MIKIENVEVVGLDHAIRGMRNPKNSWDKSDSVGCEYCGIFFSECPNNCPWLKVGPNDHKLMTALADGGPVHAKYRRMIVVYLDITAPLYWWKEFDTYKIGTVANSCSTMHKIHDKEFTLDDFSHEHLYGVDCTTWGEVIPLSNLKTTIMCLNQNRRKFLETKDKKYWWQMIQLLPTSYNQKRTIMLNYEVLVGMYKWRKTHKLDEWREFCKWIESLSYSELITGEKVDN